MDVLSEVLKAVRLEGALFYNAEFSAPWSVLSPPSQALAPHVGSGARHIVIYHLLTEGRAYAGLEDGPREPLQAGDIVVFPHGDAHVMGNGEGAVRVDNGKELERVLAQGLKVARMGGGGEVTRFVCGYLACDPLLSRNCLSALPRLMKVNIRNDAAGAWLENSIRFSVAEAGEARAGGEALVAKLSEALFVETLRRCLSLLPEAQTGWLAGVRDAQVGRALALLHRSPGRPWTLAELARAAGLSRSTLAERFQHYLGEGPMAYLTKWRLHLAARRLTESGRSVAEVAAEAGYRSEAAFNRAFKRETGEPPARFRNRARATGTSRGASG